MTEAEDADAYSLTEALAELGKLSDEDLLRLRVAARKYTYLVDYEPDDLVNEAISRAAEGVRNWPIGLSAVQFLRGIMRSVASDWYRAQKRMPTQELVSQEGEEIVLEQTKVHITPERELMAKQNLDQLRSSFHEDPVGQEVFDAMMLGFRGKELQDLHDLTKQELATVLKRIDRRIKAFVAKGQQK